jgi:hypothetical protein
VWFAGNVIGGLCEVLDEHLAVKRTDGQPAAIGCVPYLTSTEVIDRLLMMSTVCVVVDKGSALPQRLIDSPEVGFPNIALPQLSGLARTEGGKPIIIGPSTPREVTEYDLEPLRVLGWPGSRQNKPLLHAKLLVLGELRWETYGPDEAPDYLVSADFTPQSVWWGSVNWTNASRRHIEVGVVCDDPSLAREATDFVATVISHSEPVDATRLGPQRSLVDYEIDDAAMAEADYINYLARLEAEAEAQEADAEYEALSYYQSEIDDGDERG